jgi:hypothetical protein
MRRRLVGISAAFMLIAVVFGALAADATPSPNGHGQPGAPNTTCQQFTQTPGNSGTAGGAPFNPNGTAGNNYAGNPGTASANHSNSAAAVSQYDLACFQQTTH